MIERDIWATAKLVLERYGEQAQAEARKRSERLSGEGDREGQAVWEAITAAVAWLERNEAPDSAIQ